MVEVNSKRPIHTIYQKKRPIPLLGAQAKGVDERGIGRLPLGFSRCQSRTF